MDAITDFHKSGSDRGSGFYKGKQNSGERQLDFGISAFVTCTDEQKFVPHSRAAPRRTAGSGLAKPAGSRLPAWGLAGSTCRALELTLVPRGLAPAGRGACPSRGGLSGQAGVNVQAAHGAPEMVPDRAPEAPGGPGFRSARFARRPAGPGGP